MGWNQTDTAALDAARNAGITFRGVDAADPHIPVITLSCPASIDYPEPAKLLAGAIEGIDRKLGFHRATICLCVEQGNSFPGYIAEGIQLLSDQFYRVNIIVICGAASSHAPGPLLGQALRSVIAEAQIGGLIWHPVAERAVPSDPSLSEE